MLSLMQVLRACAGSAKLEAVRDMRASLEGVIQEMLDPLAAPNLPAFDLAALLLFLTEVSTSPCSNAARDSIGSLLTVPHTRIADGNSRLADERGL